MSFDICSTIVTYPPKKTFRFPTECLFLFIALFSFNETSYNSFSIVSQPGVDITVTPTTIRIIVITMEIIPKTIPAIAIPLWL